MTECHFARLCRLFLEVTKGNSDKVYRIRRIRERLVEVCTKYKTILRYNNLGVDNNNHVKIYLMNKILMMVILVVVTVFAVVLMVVHKTDDSFHDDADVIRIEDVLYWSGLIEEYHSITGHYPLEINLDNSDDIILVRLATHEQKKYFTVGSAQYIVALDNNANQAFIEYPVKDFVRVLESGLGRDIDEHYDIQKVPTGSPIWYNYFISDEGYLFWVTCTTCGINGATTLLGDGYTPTINVGSSGVTEGVPKLHTINELKALPDYIQLSSRSLQKENYTRLLQAEYFNNSKQ